MLLCRLGRSVMRAVLLGAMLHHKAGTLSELRACVGCRCYVRKLSSGGRGVLSEFCCASIGRMSALFGMVGGLWFGCPAFEGSRFVVAGLNGVVLCVVEALSCWC